MLITLAIIGVVAALTIPTLVANYQKKALVVQLQKTYTTLANAAKMVMADEQVDNLNNTYLRISEYTEDKENSVGRFLKTYFKTVKICNDNPDECIDVENYKSLDGSYGYLYTSTYCGILNSGAIICLYPFDNNNPMNISIDVNGKKGPNVIGRDTFNFDMNYRGEIAVTFDKDHIEANKPENCGSDDEIAQYYGLGCFNKIIQDGWKMDY